jgi:threonyl-tRNA synthetase
MKARITSDADQFALAFAAKAKKRGLRVETELRKEKIKYKVREHSPAKIPALIAVGRKEASESAVSVRRLGSNAQIDDGRGRGDCSTGQGGHAAGFMGGWIKKGQLDSQP